jgi:hypothetical protein
MTRPSEDAYLRGAVVIIVGLLLAALVLFLTGGKALP